MTPSELERLYSMAESFYLSGLREPDVKMKVVAWKDCISVSRAYISLGGTQNVHVFLNIALNSLGRVREAFESCIAGLRAEPDQSYLLINIKLYADFLHIDYKPGKHLN